MAFELKIGAVADKDKIQPNDATGLYNVTTNPGGYETPNPAVADQDRATIDFLPPKGEPSDIVTVDVYPTFPTSTTTTLFDVSAATLGLTEITSGIWDLTYNVFDDDLTAVYTASGKFLFTAAIECCIDKKKRLLNVDDLGSQQSQKILELEVLLDKAKDAACCGKMDEAQRLIDYLDKQCKCL